ncbi:CD276 antigen-like [Pelobates cultripes]|uniref:CD276 antigen-like n=1 Tax=Pelobates cultripes TaxID=61616 RepID=A0AAD1RIY9_PELCU|nr:CD276 antigen-like [Pelobates cultripes]
MTHQRAFIDPSSVSGRPCPCPHRYVNAHLGDTVHLPCVIPWRPQDHDKWKVTWERKSEAGGKIFVHCQEGSSGEVKQNEDYSGRTSLSPNWEEKKSGTLELRNVKLTDAGLYTFWITPLPEEPDPSSMCCEVTLIVDNMGITKEKGCCCKCALPCKETHVGHTEYALSFSK